MVFFEMGRWCWLCNVSTVCTILLILGTIWRNLPTCIGTVQVQCSTLNWYPLICCFTSMRGRYVCMHCTIASSYRIHLISWSGIYLSPIQVQWGDSSLKIYADSWEVDWPVPSTWRGEKGNLEKFGEEDHLQFPYLVLYCSHLAILFLAGWTCDEGSSSSSLSCGCSSSVSRMVNGYLSCLLN